MKGPLITSPMREFVRRPGRDPREPGTGAVLRKPQPAGLSDFQERAVAAGVQKLLSAQAFDIDALDALLQVVGRCGQPANLDYAALRALNGMTWADMGRDLAQQSREAAVRLLGMPTSIASMVEVEHPPDEPRGLAKWLRLAWWRAT